MISPEQDQPELQSEGEPAVGPDPGSHNPSLSRVLSSFVTGAAMVLLVANRIAVQSRVADMHRAVDRTLADTR